MSDAVADALNRVADALFTQAKSARKQADSTAEHVKIAREMFDIQSANLAVTKKLEERLHAQMVSEPGPLTEEEFLALVQKRPSDKSN